jgi:hypothetical protein
VKKTGVHPWAPGRVVATGGEPIPDKTDCNDFFDFVAWEGASHKIMC